MINVIKKEIDVEEVLGKTNWYDSTIVGIL